MGRSLQHRHDLRLTDSFEGRDRGTKGSRERRVDEAVETMVMHLNVHLMQKERPMKADLERQKGAVIEAKVGMNRTHETQVDLA